MNLTAYIPLFVVKFASFYSVINPFLFSTQKSVDRFSIIPNAMVAIVGEEFIKQPNPDKGKNATVRDS